MPKMGDAMTEGKVVRWYKKAGDAVKKGEPVLEIETDKVNLDLEAEQDGTLGEVAAEEGQMVPVGGVLATILGAGEKAQPKKAAAAPAAKNRRRAAPSTRKTRSSTSTGEYAEAIEMKAPRVDRDCAAASNAARAATGDERTPPLVAAGAEDGARARRQHRAGAGERAGRTHRRQRHQELQACRAPRRRRPRRRRCRRCSSSRRKRFR